MNSWLTYSNYQERYPDSALTEDQFTPLAVDAAFFVEAATRWCASLAEEQDQLELLAQCQAELVHAASETGTVWDGVTSVNNHGYTESYASGMDQQTYLGQQQQEIVSRILSAPATRWMLYRGTAYHPPRRR